MRTILTIWLLLVAGLVFSQNRAGDFSYIDRAIQTIDDKDPALLASKLTSSYKTEIEKTRAIFRWITEHISYYKKAPPSRKRQRKMLNYELAGNEDTAALLPLTDRVATKVLQDRKAVCEGYSRLFKSLCDHAGLRSEIITGYARSEPTIVQSRFRSNHSWNAVNIDGRWYLLDVTWASGVTIFPTGEFLKYYDDYYFLTAPEKFIRHHYPDDLRWTLLDDAPEINEFQYAPFKQRSFVKYPISHYFPERGIIEASVGDTIRVELETDPSERNWSVAADSLWENIDAANPFCAYVQPDFTTNGTRMKYSFAVVSDHVQWLHIMYNNDAVLRYRLKIKKDLVKDNSNNHHKME